ncbi:hypothetical protein KS4_18220 [Poriferisphaera corsica]|uniref:Uncharacterized protein n=1 Tax=Poriferisphaera corsica TaxID=2528020 RepID=A0A517YU57_9BACT|nr:hypothetical protein [Poriferisphaera corsica]QDU33765.1 hypothetical protein KS4_18220 [Poriferisphaera corsica]
MAETEYEKTIDAETLVAIDPATTVLVRSDDGDLDVSLVVRSRGQTTTTAPKTIRSGEERPWCRGYREIVGFVFTPKGGTAKVTYDILAR